LLGASAFLIALVVMLMTRVIAPRSHRVPFTTAILFLTLSLTAFLARQLSMQFAETARLFAAVSILLYALALARLVFLLAFDAILMRKGSDPTPRIVRDIAQGALFFFATIAGLRGAGVEAGQLLTTSALITVVAGMALQETLGNLVAGLAMQGERPFEVGDWIEVHGTPSHIGKVREINWRATRLHTLDNVDVVVPNGLLAKAMFTNYDRPHEAARRSVYFHTSYATPPRRVHEIVVEAIREAPGVLTDPPPSLVTNNFTDAGVQFWLRYYITEMGRRDTIDGGVRDRVWYSLERNGIALSIPGRAIAMHEVSAETERAKVEHKQLDRLGAIRQIDLFSSLDEPALSRLASDSRSALFAPGETVIRRGEAGDTMFVVRSGELSVRLPSNGVESETARLGPEAFFGEMSLLTGSARQATVVALRSCELLVIDHDALRRLLDEHPDVAHQISVKVTERRRANQESLEHAETVRDKPTVDESEDLLKRIRGFFGLRH
jgi:small-conductance mechanosensitive channel/CRP-like cAMP-binding protein